MSKTINEKAYALALSGIDGLGLDEDGNYVDKYSGEELYFKKKQLLNLEADCYFANNLSQSLESFKSVAKRQNKPVATNCTLDRFLEGNEEVNKEEPKGTKDSEEAEKEVVNKSAKEKEPKLKEFEKSEKDCWWER